jgi:hypothetical protein
VLVVNEVQGDWGQAACKRGFATPRNPTTVTSTNPQGLRAAGGFVMVAEDDHVGMNSRDFQHFPLKKI